jgi:hypothetical protein
MSSGIRIWAIGWEAIVFSFRLSSFPFYTISPTSRTT